MPWRAWSVLRPDLVLVCLFYWRLYRPDRCGVGMAFGAGLTVDFLSGAPPGLNAFTKVWVVLVVGSHGQRLRAADFLMVLPVFFLLVLAEEVVQTLLVAIVHAGLGGELIWWPLFAGRPLATALWAPTVTLLMINLHHAWLGKVFRDRQ